MDSPLDTIAAIATPLGESALGIIRLSGSDAIAILQSIFQSAKTVDLAQVPSHTCRVGYIKNVIPAKANSIVVAPAGSKPGPIESHDGSRPIACRDDVVRGGDDDQDGKTIDQVIVTLFRSPTSYTGEDVVEISAHGNPWVLRRILELCLKMGARLARPGEFTERAFLEGKMDLTQAEAVADLIRAKTDKSHAAAFAQLEGHLTDKVRALREQLVPLLAHIEVGLDHSDEDHPFLSRAELVQACRAVQREIEGLLESARVGKILREGLRVALVGRPNVGKSSLMNALLKEDRAIVTPIPGTTRDTLEEPVDWAGLPVVLTDTAGVRLATDDPVEKLGIERTRQAIKGADFVLCLFDASEPLNAEDEAVLRECAAKPHIWVVNKTDLPTLWDPKQLHTLNGNTPSPSPPPDVRRGHATSQADPPRRVADLASCVAGLPPGARDSLHSSLSPTGERVQGEGGTQQTATLKLEYRFNENAPLVSVSAKTGQGLENLVQTVAAHALPGEASSGETRWLINTRHRAALERAHQGIERAAEAAQSGAFEECVALELRTALVSLGEIIGETTTEDMLDQIFSKFCVGK